MSLFRVGSFGWSYRDNKVKPECKGAFTQMPLSDIQHKGLLPNGAAIKMLAHLQS